MVVIIIIHDPIYTLKPLNMALIQIRLVPKISTKKSLLVASRNKCHLDWNINHLLKLESHRLCGIFRDTSRLYYAEEMAPIVNTGILINIVWSLVVQISEGLVINWGIYRHIAKCDLHLFREIWISINVWKSYRKL